MATSGFTNISSNGLVMYLDAGNSKSYTPPPGGFFPISIDWNDLSKNGANATMYSYDYSSLYGGNFNFVLGDPELFNPPTYADFTCSGLTNTATIEFFANITIDPSSFGMVFGWNTYDIYFYINQFGFNTANNDLYGISSTKVNSLGLLNNWRHYVCVMRSDVSYTNNKIYINGELQTLSQIIGTELPSNRNFNNGVGRISGWVSSTGYNIPMNLSFFKIYNRELTAAEVRQNYNAIKYRFV